MAENLTDRMHRDWTSYHNEDTTDYHQRSRFSRLLSRKISDKNNQNYADQHHSSNSDFNDPSSSVVTHSNKSLHGNRGNSDASYDTDGALASHGGRSKHHRHTSENYEHLVTPRLSVRRPEEHASKLVKSVPIQSRLSQKTRSNGNASISTSQNHDDRDEDNHNERDSQRRRVRLSHRRLQQGTPTNGNHGARPVHPAGLVQHNRALAATPSAQPLRIIFMRHGERANQALGPDWFFRAFRTNTYRAYDQNLPFVLPKRRYDQAYEFDVPLTGEIHHSMRTIFDRINF